MMPLLLQLKQHNLHCSNNFYVFSKADLYRDRLFSFLAYFYLVLMQAFFTLAQLFVVTLAGLGLAKSAVGMYTRPMIKWIPWIIYLLLFTVAFEVGAHLAHIAWEVIVLQGMVLSFLLISANLLALFIIFLPQKKRLSIHTRFRASAPFKHIFRELAYTIMAFILGFCAYWIADLWQLEFLLDSWSVLLFLMFLIGMDLASLKLSDTPFSLSLFLIPIIMLLSSSLIALLFPVIFSTLDWRQSMALAQGYGWYSMSAPMQKELGSPYLGTIALIIDLNREIFAIFFIQTLGRLFPNTAVGLGGATSMDATLGMIQQNCGQHFLVYAVFSGLILSCIGPVLIVWLLSY